jgi:hypothetical protein
MLVYILWSVVRQGNVAIGSNRAFSIHSEKRLVLIILLGYQAMIWETFCNIVQKFPCYSFALMQYKSSVVKVTMWSRDPAPVTSHPCTRLRINRAAQLRTHFPFFISHVSNLSPFPPKPFFAPLYIVDIWLLLNDNLSTSNWNFATRDRAVLPHPKSMRILWNLQPKLQAS